MGTTAAIERSDKAAGLTPNQIKLRRRNEQRKAQAQAEQMQKNYKAGDAVREARANMHTGMNRARRRKIAAEHGVFKYPGLFGQLLDRAALDKKTYRKKVVNA